jgi:ABC-2 type transport system permease protein
VTTPVTPELPLSPKARVMHGPSAFGGTPRRFWNLTWMLAVTDFRMSYFGSVLGYLWSLMRPLLFFGVLYLVFSKVLRVGGNVRDYPVVLLLNIVLFSFFSEATGQSVASMVVREPLVRKMQFPRMVVPLATVLTSAINLLLNLAAVLVFLLIYGIRPHWTWLLFPLVLAPLIVFTAGMAMLLSALYVRYRDVAPIWTVVSQLLFYGTPIIYTIEKVHEQSVRASHLVLLNPLGDLLQYARKWVIDPHAQSGVDAIGGWLHFLGPMLIFVAVIVVGLWVFNRQAPHIAEEL